MFLNLFLYFLHPFVFTLENENYEINKANQEQSRLFSKFVKDQCWQKVIIIV